MIELKGTEEFKDALAVYADKVSSDVKDAIAESANAIAEAAKKNTSGELSDSISAEVADDGLSAVITADSPHAVFVEYGVKIPAIKAEKAKALHFKIDGKDVFAKSAKAHSIPPKPFLNPAFEDNRQDILDNISNILNA